MAVTRAEVAAKAGVSPAVVSYVVNGGPRPVASGTRMRVEAAIDELGYRPNRIAAALRGGMTRSIGLLTPSTRNPFYAELAEALVGELFRQGNTLSIGITDDDQSRERLYLRSLLDRRVDGIILTSAHLVRTLGDLDRSDIPTLLIDRVNEETVNSCSRVYVDSERGARHAVEHLQAHGHSVIGCVAGPWPVPLVEDRVQGWRTQQQVLGFRETSELIEHADFSEAGGREATLALLGSGSRRNAAHTPRPTALFVTSDVQAFGAIVACRELGLQVPEDVAIVSFDGTATGRFANPPLTSVRQPIVDMARTAVELLLERTGGSPHGPADRMFAGNLVIGETCGCGVYQPETP
ncbi:LacI family DNA-binding transcriptional regulator [Ruania alba]|uniref:Transcriptional regulator, LacI family n=1 Tax=Ruania alba TaxID=648782 RepID=A0A1H5MFN8_9MICO|nr:LacI family DNA-binding transcriptional regulator [Ruania alba]SEE87537.1 transcriptional regulator, LacI family [Ruania alba]